MRIALLTHQWPGVRLGGIGVYTMQCARALAEAGHEAHVFTLTVPADVAAGGGGPAGVHLHTVADLAERVAAGNVPKALAAAVHAGGEAIYRLALGTLLCERVRRVHADRPFDIVEGPEYEALGLPLMLAPLSGEVRMVTHLHAGSAILHQRNGATSPGAGGALAFEALECAAIVGADARCAPSRQVVADTEALCPVPDAEVLPLPFYAESPARDSSGGEGDAVLYIGRLELIKGAHLLPDAANDFLSRHPEAQMRIAGPDTAASPDPAMPSMAGWIRAHLRPEVAGRVHFLGEQDQGQLARELARAAFVIVPSLAESYSYVCCESLAAGRPVAVSEGIGATEVVGDAGIAFERGNAGALAAAMGRLWEDEALRGRLSKIAERRARTVLSAEQTIQARVRFYERVCAMKPAGDDRLARMPARYAGPLVRALGQMAAFLSGVEAAALTPGMRLRQLMAREAARTGRPARVVLYGAGRFTSRLLSEAHVWEDGGEGHRVVGLIDDARRWRDGGTHLGLPVEPLARFQSRLPVADSPMVVLSTDAFQRQFWEQTASLRERGIRVFRLDQQGGEG